MNAHYTPNELQIGIDVGSLNHSFAISDDKERFIQILCKACHVYGVIHPKKQLRSTSTAPNLP